MERRIYGRYNSLLKLLLLDLQGEIYISDFIKWLKLKVLFKTTWCTATKLVYMSCLNAISPQADKICQEGSGRLGETNQENSRSLFFQSHLNPPSDGDDQEQKAHLDPSSEAPGWTMAKVSKHVGATGHTGFFRNMLHSYHLKHLSKNHK